MTGKVWWAHTLPLAPTPQVTSDNVEEVMSLERSSTAADCTARLQACFVKASTPDARSDLLLAFRTHVLRTGAAAIGKSMEPAGGLRACVVCECVCT